MSAYLPFSVKHGPDPSPWRLLNAVAGTLLFGGAAPVLVFLRANHSIFLGLGFSCAAYVVHAFLTSTRARSRSQWIAFGVATGLAVTYHGWNLLVGELLDKLTAAFEPVASPGVPTINVVQLLSGPMVTGAIMACAFWAMTRSMAVLITALVASIVSSIFAFATNGATAILWNFAIATALYSWALAWGAPRPARDRTCDACGYSLEGLPTNQCPECGKVARITSSST